MVRKSAHFLPYLVLGVLVINSSRRSGQVKDVLIDSAGAAVGIGMYLKIIKSKGKVNGNNSKRST